MSKFMKQATAAELGTLDTVIQRRLLFEGSTNADTRITKLVNQFCTWCEMDTPDEKTNTMHLTKLRMNVERVMVDGKRSHLAVKANENRIAEYLSLKEKIKEEMIITRHQIDKHKRLNAELQMAKSERMEYDHLLSLVISKPDRKTVELKAQKLKKEVDTMQVKLSELESVMTVRKKQLTALMQDLSMLRDFDPEEEPKNGLNASRDSGATSTKKVLRDNGKTKPGGEKNVSVASLPVNNSMLLSSVEEIQSDEDNIVQDLSSTYCLQIKEPGKDVVNVPETLFVIQASPKAATDDHDDVNIYEDFLLAPDKDIEMNSDEHVVSADISLTDILSDEGEEISTKQLTEVVDKVVGSEEGTSTPDKVVGPDTLIANPDLLDVSSIELDSSSDQLAAMEIATD